MWKKGRLVPSGFGCVVSRTRISRGGWETSKAISPYHSPRYLCVCSPMVILVVVAKALMTSQPAAPSAKKKVPYRAYGASRPLEGRVRTERDSTKHAPISRLQGQQVSSYGAGYRNHRPYRNRYHAQAQGRKRKCGNPMRRVNVYAEPTACGEWQKQRSQWHETGRDSSIGKPVR
jgi:hypothetical protein